MKCCDKYCDERIKERETEIFKLNRDLSLIHIYKIILGGNPIYYYYFGKMEKTNFYGHNTKDSHMCVNKIEKCYLKPRLIFDDGG